MGHRITVRHYFDAAHQLPDSDELVTKACARLHGHTYAVIVDVERPDSNLNSAGMVIDFKAIKNEIDKLDHRFINEVFKDDEYDYPPTAENIAQWIYDKLWKIGLTVKEVKVCEGYKGEDKASWAIYG